MATTTAVQAVDESESSNLQWNPQLDTLLSTWCDQAKAFEWLHNETSNLYNRISKCFVIGLTTLTAFSGATNIISGSIVVNGFQISWLFGILAIIASLGNVLQGKLGYAEAAQAHRGFCSSWGQIHRQMEAEIVLPYTERKDASSFVKMIKTAIDQVSNDGASLIPEHILKECYKKFSGTKDFVLPDICNVMTHTVVYVAPVVAPTTSTPLIPTPPLVTKTLPYIPPPSTKPKSSS